LTDDLTTDRIQNKPEFSSMKEFTMRTFKPVALTASLSSLLLAFALIYPLTLAQGSPKLVYTYTAKGLTGPMTISGTGFQNILFVNNSGMDLDITILKPHQGATVEAIVTADKALAAALEGSGDPAKTMTNMIGLADVPGGIHTAAKTRASAYIKLEPGRYVFQASTGGHGDPYKSFYPLVNVSKGAVAAAPKEDFALQMMDFHFDFPKTMKVGEQLWKISNTGAQPHLALIFRLAKGKNAQDVIKTLDSNSAGPPPVEDMIILQAATTGQTFYTPVKLAPGNYVVVCPLPDVKTGKSHYAEGMVSTFTVK
jgi:hypothetical protein